MKKFLRFLLYKPLLWLANKYSSAPKKENVLQALSHLYLEIKNGEKKNKGITLKYDANNVRIIIFSDQHKGARNGADDFALAAKNYRAALEFYHKENFSFINLGDCEELWENNIVTVIKHNKQEFEYEKKFIDNKRYFKIFGNHDLLWDNDPFTSSYLKKMYEQNIKIFTGIILNIHTQHGAIDFFCTHGHQGDLQSDGNAFSKWFVSNVWGPLQNFIGINPNTPSTNDNVKTLHNLFMYEWSCSQPKTVLITGHTHQPVFNSLTHLERLYLQLEEATARKDATAIEKIQKEIPRRKREYDFVNNSFRSMKPSYFNSGCCCFEDGTITGIEIADGCIKLVKWSYINDNSTRTIAEENKLEELALRL